MYCLFSGFSWPALLVQSYLQCKTKTASLGQEPRAVQGAKTTRGRDKEAWSVVK